MRQHSPILAVSWANAQRKRKEPLRGVCWLPLALEMICADEPAAVSKQRGLVTGWNRDDDGKRQLRSREL